MFSCLSGDGRVYQPFYKVNDRLSLYYFMLVYTLYGMVAGMRGNRLIEMLSILAAVTYNGDMSDDV